MKLTVEEIERGRSQAGGWTAKTLRKWGVPWPPPKGWRKALLAGKPINKGSRKRRNDPIQTIRAETIYQEVSIKIGKR